MRKPVVQLDQLSPAQATARCNRGRLRSFAIFLSFILYPIFPICSTTDVLDSESFQFSNLGRQHTDHDRDIYVYAARTHPRHPCHFTSILPDLSSLHMRRRGLCQGPACQDRDRLHGMPHSSSCRRQGRHPPCPRSTLLHLSFLRPSLTPLVAPCLRTE